MAKSAPKTAVSARKMPVGGAADANNSPVQYANTQAPAVKRPPPPPVSTWKGIPPTPPLLPAKPRSKVPLYVGGTFLYALVVYGAYVFISTSNSIPKGSIHAKPLDKQEDTSHIYDSIANKYDKEIWTSEFFMGMPLLRRSMAKRATGDVLEASAGTGRNIKWYPLSGRKITSITMVDTSVPMLQIARNAFHERHPKYKNVHFIIQDAATPLASPSGGKFDTVIQSMGLCSHHSPVQLLRNLGDACKDEGNIILLEHGKSHYDWLNRILDRFSEKHAEMWGCWWNRDVEAIVAESGLRVVKLKRYHFGTTYWIAAKPPLRNDTPSSAK